MPLAGSESLSGALGSLSPRRARPYYSVTCSNNKGPAGARPVYSRVASANYAFRVTGFMASFVIWKAVLCHTDLFFYGFERAGPGTGSHREQGTEPPIPIPTAIPDLPGIVSTIEYCKRVEFRLPQCLTLRLIVLPKLINLRRPAMSDGAVDYSGTSDSDSESVTDKVPSRLPARAESCILAHDLSVLHAGFGCAPSSPE